MTQAIDIVHEPARARVLLDSTRLALLERLAEPNSAAGLARALGLPRQRVNYHLRELAAQRLVELVDERAHGSVTERRYRRTGTAYVLSPATLGALAVSPDQQQDKLSAAFQVALASRTIRELDELERGAAAAGQRLPTFAIETELRFASPAARAAFAAELTDMIAALVAKHHDGNAREGRSYRLQVGAYPRPKADAPS